MSYTSQDGLKQEVYISKYVIEKKENTFAKILLSKSVPYNSVVVRKQVITPRTGNVFGEGSQITEGTKSVRIPVENTQAIYGDTIEVSRTAMIVDKTAYEVEVQNASLGYKTWLEKMALKGCTAEGRTTKGLIDFVPVANKQDIVGEVTGTKLSIALKGLKAPANLIIAGVDAVIKIDQLAEQTNVDNSSFFGFKGTIKHLIVRNADAFVLVSDEMDSDKALFLNTDFLERDYITNGSITKLAKTGFDGDEYQLIDESCVFYTMPNALALVTFKETL